MRLSVNIFIWAGSARWPTLGRAQVPRGHLLRCRLMSFLVRRKAFECEAGCGLVKNTCQLPYWAVTAAETGPAAPSFSSCQLAPLHRCRHAPALTPKGVPPGPSARLSAALQPSLRVWRHRPTRPGRGTSPLSAASLGAIRFLCLSVQRVTCPFHRHSLTYAHHPFEEALVATIVIKLEMLLFKAMFKKTLCLKKIENKRPTA